MYNDGGYELLFAAFMIALPFIALIVLLIIGTILIARKHHRYSQQGIHKKSGFKYLKYSSIACVVVGWLILINFAISGGPNKGIGKHIYNSSDNPYFDMQLAFILIAIGIILGFISLRSVQKTK